MLKRLPLAVLLVGASSAWGQQVISAHSGVIHFVEGQVTLEGQTVQPKFAEFPDVKNGQTGEALEERSIGNRDVRLAQTHDARIADHTDDLDVSELRIAPDSDLATDRMAVRE